MVRQTGRMRQKENLRTGRMLRQTVSGRTVRLSPELRLEQTGRMRLTAQQLLMARTLQQAQPLTVMILRKTQRLTAIIQPAKK